MFVNFNILNQLGSPAINSNTFANRPAAGQTGRLFVSTDTFEIYRDNGTTWDLIGGPGSSTITGTGTATQVAYFTSSQAIGSSANLYWDNTNTRLGIGTSTPGVRLDIHGTGIMQHINATSATANSLMAFQRTGTNVWRLGDQYNGGSNYFELHNTALANNAIEVLAASNEATFLSSKTYTTGNAIGVAVQHNLTIPNAVNVGLAALGGLNSNLNLTLGGSTTVSNTGRQGLEGSTSIRFTGAGTLTMTQASTIRAFSAISSVYSFNSTAVGTITHLAGLRICFPDNVGSAVNITNNYALLINNQTTGTGTVTYTNRWGIYQEGASDLNYMAANLLLGSTVNTGDKLQVTGTTYLSSQLTVGNTLYVDTVFNRVGIGTLSPAYTLDVNGTGRFSGSVTFASGVYNYIGTNRFFLGTSGTYNYLYTGSTALQILNQADVSALVTILDGGNVGIGTTNPSGKLEVAIGTGFVRFNRSGAGESDFSIDSSGNAVYDVSIGAGQIFRTNGGSPRMTIISGGNVGIGTTTPQVKLHVLNSAVGGSYYGGLTLETSGEAAMQIKGTTYSSIYFSDAANPYEGGIVYDHILDNLEFRGSGNAPDLTITSGGNVLIGTQTNSGEKLIVNGTNARFYSNGNYNSINIDNNSTTGGGACAVFQNNVRVGAIGVDGWWQGTGQDDLAIAADKPNIKFYTNGGSQVKMSLSSAGNLETLGTIKTGAPTTGTAAAWKLGSRVAAAVALDATQYIEVDIGGTLYKLAIVT